MDYNKKEDNVIITNYIGLDFMTTMCYSSSKDKMEGLERIGRKVKIMREKAGLKQDQIATYLGVDQSNVSKCEAGERQFTVDALEKLCDLFGCELNELMSEETPTETLEFAFRSKVIKSEDLTAIANINRIALNIKQMRQYLRENKLEG